jgi:hypothetical protein
MFFQRRLKLSVALAATCFLSLSSTLSSKGAGQDAQPSGGGCLSCHQKIGDKSVDLFRRSTHAKANISCTSCHGGDPFSDEKAKAHTGRFVASPTPGQLINICGSCHVTQLEMFRGSRHFPEQKGQARIDCAQCHGAHTVGAPSESFSIAYLCAGCHGLEYLPELPESFKSLMALSDEVQGRMRELRESNRQVSDDVMRLRREIRRSISEIVHPTDSQGGPGKVPAILRLGEEFKRAVERGKNSDRRKGD